MAPIPLVVEVYSVERDGLPDMEDQGSVGKVAFIWDGNIVSGWPLPKEGSDVWEPSEDRFGGPVRGVEYWVRFPFALWSFGVLG